MDNFEKQFKRIEDNLLQAMKDEGRSNRDFVRQEIQASEKRVTDKLMGEIQATEQRIVDSVSDVLSGSVLPQLDNHEQRLTKLETKPA